MKIYQIEVDDKLDAKITDAAQRTNSSAEKFIVSILKRYVVLMHTMDNEDVKKGYEDCGELNLELANL